MVCVIITIILFAALYVESVVDKRPK